MYFVETVVLFKIRTVLTSPAKVAIGVLGTLVVSAARAPSSPNLVCSPRIF